MVVSCDCEPNARCNRSRVSDAKCDSLVKEGQWRNPQGHWAGTFRDLEKAAAGGKLGI